MRAFAMLRTAALATLLLATAGARQEARRDTIDVGVEDAAAPWSQADGTGYANDLARAAFAAAGIDIRLHVLPYARCKQHVVNGELVACISMSHAPELMNKVRFSAQPVFVFTCEFFENNRAPLPRRIQDLPRGIKVGTVIGYEYPPEMLSTLTRVGAVLEATATEEINLRKLAAGRIGAAVVNSDAVKPSGSVVARAGVTGRVTSRFSIGRTPGYVGFSRKHRRGRELADRFDRGYARIIASGERDRIQRRWIAQAAAARP